MSFSAIGQTVAQRLDAELMDPNVGAYTLAQLMELAGLSVAQAVRHAYSSARVVVVVCGPGNNGGDGLVAARHLSFFGFTPIVFTPRQGKNPYFKLLYSQLDNIGVPTFYAPDNVSPETNTKDVKTLTNDQFIETLSSCDLILDAIFGFSFHGPLKPPFDGIIDAINVSGKPVVSIDMPTGWDVEKGKIDSNCIDSPDMLISLTIPKMGAKDFKGRYHYLGGRFVPPDFASSHKLNIPKYPGYDQFVNITNMPFNYNNQKL